jgi:hypothetical protein
MAAWYPFAAALAWQVRFFGISLGVILSVPPIRAGLDAVPRRPELEGEIRRHFLESHLELVEDPLLIVFKAEQQGLVLLEPSPKLLLLSFVGFRGHGIAPTCEAGARISYIACQAFRVCDLANPHPVVTSLRCPRDVQTVG